MSLTLEVSHVCIGPRLCPVQSPVELSSRHVLTSCLIEVSLKSFALVHVASTSLQFDNKVGVSESESTHFHLALKLSAPLNISSFDWSEGTSQLEISYLKFFAFWNI